MKKYKLIVTDEETGEGVMTWYFDLTKEGKIKFLPSGKTIKDAIKNHNKGFIFTNRE